MTSQVSRRIWWDPRSPVIASTGAGIVLVIMLVLPFSDMPSVFAEQKGKKQQVEAALRKKTLKVRRGACEDLADLVKWAARKGLRQEADDLVAAIKSLHPTYDDLDRVQEVAAHAAEPATDANLDELRAQLAEKTTKAQEGQAKRCYRFATQCFKAGLFSRAYELLNETCALAPGDTYRDEKKARKILGYTWDKKQQCWLTNWEAGMKKKHFLTEEGWVPKKNKKQWDEGLRPYKGRWVTIEEERRIRTRNDLNPFRVQSESFEINTNLGRKEGWQYAQMLEDFNRAFYAFFIGYYDQKSGAKLLFKRTRTDKKHKVFIFPSHAAYLKHVKKEHGNRKILRESAGFYSSSDRLSRFYWSDNPGPTLSTMYHETAHQLFAETKDNNLGGSTGNNWVVEGIATYVETWAHIDGKWYPGMKTGSPPMQRAKNILQTGSAPWTGLMEFATIGYREFHGDEHRGARYALSCALSHFFLHHDNEVYREDFMRFISDYYAGKVRHKSLVAYFEFDDKVKEVDDKFGVLEKRFLEYMANLSS